jgi:nucleotide-binding universal stress UspA family protein
MILIQKLKINMERVFNKIGLAITFSPTGKALLNEVKRLKFLFNSELCLIHVGERTPATEQLLKDKIISSGMVDSDSYVAWTSGDPAAAIIKEAQKQEVDLLVAGALEKENIIKYYIGSVARKLMRDAHSSVLILKSPTETPTSFKRFVVATDFSSESEETIRKSFEFALLEKADEFVIIRDYHIPGLAAIVQETGSFDDVENKKESWQNEEEEKMRLYLKELNLKGLPVRSEVIYGKEGWEAGNYARINKADIFSVTAPTRRLKFWDRLFPNEVEYSFQSLPSNLLIIR